MSLLTFYGLTLFYLKIGFYQPIYCRGVASFGKPNINSICIDCHSKPTDPDQLIWALLTLFVVSVLFCTLCCCRCYPKLKQFFSQNTDRVNSIQIPPPGYSKKKSSSICSTLQQTNNLNSKRESSSHFQPISIEINESSPTPPINQSTLKKNRRLSSVNNLTISPKFTNKNNLNTISALCASYSSQEQHPVVVQSSSAINELGLNKNIQSKGRSSVGNLLISPKLNNFTYYDKKDFYNYTPVSFNQNQMLKNKQRKHSCVAAIGLPSKENTYVSTSTSFLNSNHLNKTRRHSKAVVDMYSPSCSKNNRKKQSLQNNFLKNSLEFLNTDDSYKNLNNFNNSNQDNRSRKYSNTNIPMISRKQSRSEQLCEDENSFY